MNANKKEKPDDYLNRLSGRLFSGWVSSLLSPTLRLFASIRGLDSWPGLGISKMPLFVGGFLVLAGRHESR
jgi:hypothetical protein